MDFTGAQMVDFVLAGTSKSCDYMRPSDITTCFRCGHRISNVFIVDVPAVRELVSMGGDCLATVTGDNSTRRLFAKVVKELHRHDFNSLKVVNGALWACKTVAIREWDGSAITKDRCVAVGNEIILKAAAVHWLEVNRDGYGFRETTES